MAGNVKDIEHLHQNDDDRPLIMSLSDELILLIFAQLADGHHLLPNAQTIANLSKVCMRFEMILKDKHLWKVPLRQIGLFRQKSLEQCYVDYLWEILNKLIILPVYMAPISNSRLHQTDMWSKCDFPRERAFYTFTKIGQLSKVCNIHQGCRGFYLLSIPPCIKPTQITKGKMRAEFNISKEQVVGLITPTIKFFRNPFYFAKRPEFSIFERCRSNFDEANQEVLLNELTKVR